MTTSYDACIYMNVDVAKGDTMARPIQATPKLNKEETIRFVNRLWSEQDTKEIIDLRSSVRIVREKRCGSGKGVEK